MEEEKQPDVNLEKELNINPEKQLDVSLEKEPDVNLEKQPDVNLEKELNINREKVLDVNLEKELDVQSEKEPNVLKKEPQHEMDNILGDENQTSAINELEQSIQKVGPWLKIHEAELNAYLEAEKPKPKKLTIAERLKQMPGYAQISNFKPKLGKGCKEEGGMVDLDFAKPRKPPNKGLQLLMNRFAEHTKVIKPEKEQHFKIHVSKKEEDSQGVEHTVVDEVDYIKTVNSDEESEITGASPKNDEIPGARMFEHKKLLKQKIYAQKAKEYAEKMKLHEMYAEEKELEEKGAYDPVLDDEAEMDGSSESEIDEDEEEELEDLLSGTSKEKRRKRIAYIDDEAEDSDEGAGGDDENEESDAEDGSDVEDDNDDDGDDDELLKLEDIDIDKNTDDHNTDDFGMGTDQECQFSLPSAQPQTEKKQSTIEEATTNTVKICLQKLDITPQLPQKTPSDLWLRPIVRCPQRVTPEVPQIEESNSESISTNLSQTEEMSQENSQLSSSCKSSIPAVVADLVEGIGDRTSQNNEDLLNMCSGSFPSQQPKTPEESQNDCFGFDDDDEDDLIFATLDESGSVPPVVTPKVAGNQNKSVLENETPKLSDRVSTTKRLIFEENKEDNKNETPKHFEKISKTVLFSSTEEQNDDADSDSSDDEDVGVIRNVKKRKRLEFSDEEDEDAASDLNEEEDLAEEQVDETPFEDEEMAMEIEARTVKPKKSLFGKSGKLRKEFIDAEAELSGSEVGSEDEDERGLDHMEQEVADEEVIDEDEVREKVGRAHLRALLDEDDKNIQELQDKFLHDGDLQLDGGRQRNFKWNYMQYDMEDDRANMPDFGNDIAIDEDEMKRQVEKAEKTKWMQENSQLFEESQQESQKSLFGNTSFLKLGKANLRRITSFSESSSFQGCDFKDSSISFTSFSRLLTGQVKNIVTTNVGEKKDDELPLCKATSQPLFASPDEPISKMKKGSFLSRGAPSLSRLAEMTKISDTVSNVKSNSKNFVFSVVTPPNDSKEDNSNSKKIPLRRNQSLTSNPKKMLKIDRSFNTLDSTSKEASIFRWI